MTKKFSVILLNVIFILAILSTVVNAYSADVTLTTQSKLEAGQYVEVFLKLENINATDKGVNVVKGKVVYDSDVFDNYTVEMKNNWSQTNQGETFLFEKTTGVTLNEEVAILKFKVKDSISKDSTEIKFSNITVSGVIKANGGPGDITVAGATIKISKASTPVVTKENVETNGTESTSIASKIGTSKSNDDKLPYTGEKENVILGITLFTVAAIVIFIKYRNIDR